MDAETKYFVYSARTTREGLAKLNELKTKLGVSWDKLINDAVCEKYGLDPAVINLPPSEYMKKREAAKQAKDATTQGQENTEPPTNEPEKGITLAKKKGGKKQASKQQ